MLEELQRKVESVELELKDRESCVVEVCTYVPHNTVVDDMVDHSLCLYCAGFSLKRSAEAERRATFCQLKYYYY